MKKTKGTKTGFSSGIIELDDDTLEGVTGGMKAINQTYHGQQVYQDNNGIDFLGQGTKISMVYNSLPHGTVLDSGDVYK